VVTIRDVAEAAEVSTATVTRVLTKPESVAPATADRVRRAVDELGYRPNLVARSLRKRTAQVVGYVVQDIETPHFMSIGRGVEDALRRRNYSVTFCNTDNQVSREHAYLEMLADQSVAGVIMTPASAERTDIGILNTSRIPVVTLETELHGAVDAVHADNEVGAWMAATHLLDEGARRLACVTGAEDLPNARERLAGYQRALVERGRTLDPTLWAYTDYHEEQGYAAVRRFFELAEPPDSLLTANGRLLIGALRALRDLGLHVSQDVTLASFDETPLMELMTPPITTVSQRAREMGERAAELLLERIGGYSGPARRVALAPELMVRSSSRRRVSGDHDATTDSRP
jgi:DNA-binding LacI/PurR family transcriptional regulator